MDPVFLGLGDVLLIHRDQIERYGGDPGVRDIGLLQSALAMPQAGFGGRFLHNDIYEMAAAYLFHVAQNHPFVDGNKRTGAAAALVFLDLNGVDLEISEDALVDVVMAVAEGKADKTEVAEFFRKRSIAG